MLKHGNWRVLQSKHPDASEPVQLSVAFVRKHDPFERIELSRRQI
jgi:hypothetical protein